MISYIEEKNAVKHVFKEPYERTITVLAAPWTLGSAKIWLGIDEIVVNSSSDPHSHEDREEVLYFLSGRGRVQVDGEEIRVKSGYCVLLPIGKIHRVINDGEEILRFVAVVAPAFEEPFDKSN